MTGVLAVSADKVSAGPIGLLIVLLLFVSTILLIRSMNGRLRRLPARFPPDAREPLDPNDPRADPPAPRSPPKA